MPKKKMRPPGKNREMPQREVHCADAVAWLRAQPDHSLGHIVTALPDLSDMGKAMTARKYEEWFERACHLCLQKTRPECYAIFCQTDRKVDGVWLDKSAALHRAAAAAGVPLRWHKIVVRREGTDLHRPTYSHLMCFSAKGRPGSASPDLLSMGKTVYRDGMGLDVVAFVMRFLSGGSKPAEVVDPFVGRGTTLAAANAYGMDAVGVDMVKAQCAHARALVLRRMRDGSLEA
jgi:hypothetical protein